MAVVVFNYDLWAMQFPTIAAAVPAPLAQLYFDRRTPSYLDNTDCSEITDLNERAGLLDLLVAHIASVSGTFGASGEGLVGRISSVTEGSVTIASEYPVQGDMAAWFAQSPAGAQFWAATARFRHAIYVPGRQPFLDVPGAGGWGGGRRWPN